jgi:site-specific DNA-methyltransferase (adenine-specific)
MEPYYTDGQITIYHADCRDVLPIVDPDEVDLVLTDPPYGDRQSEQRRSKRAANDPGHDAGFAMIHGDDEPFEPSPLFVYRRLVLFGANHYADKLPASKSWLVWDKRNGATPDDNADAELIWTNVPGVIRTYRQCWRGFSRENDSLEPERHVHPTQKPVNLMMWLLERYTKPGDLVFDPYMGSGPIPKACKLLGRRYVGCDVVETYCATAVRRLQQSVLPLDIPA